MRPDLTIIDDIMARGGRNDVLVLWPRKTAMMIRGAFPRSFKARPIVTDTDELRRGQVGVMRSTTLTEQVPR